MVSCTAGPIRQLLDPDRLLRAPGTGHEALKRWRRQIVALALEVGFTPVIVHRLLPPEQRHLEWNKLADNLWRACTR